jgi:peptide/nickel transport system permease protein
VAGIGLAWDATSRSGIVHGARASLLVGCVATPWPLVIGLAVGIPGRLFLRLGAATRS